MDFVVLMKAVPRAETIRYDAERGRMVRDGAELVINPFDQRALRVALELRRPGEHVTVVSLGPLEALGALRETRALGADRAVLLTDAAFAGSDTWATARALARAVLDYGHDLVLAGAWTTDSETGQVGAEVAELLNRTLLSVARAVRRDDEGDGFEVTVDTPVGWTTYRSRLPLVLTVGEKIAKPLRASPEAIASLTEPSVELRDAASLGLPLGDIGSAGSPTVVGRVETAAPARSPQVFREGPVIDRVTEAVRALAPRLRAPRPTPAPLPSPPAERPDAREVLVLVTGPSGDLASASLGVVSEVRRSLPEHWPSAVWVGPPPTESATFQLELAGTLGGYCFSARPPRVSPRTVAADLAALRAERPSVAAVVLPSDSFGREVAGRFAAHDRLGLVGDATGMRFDAREGFVWSKPSFGGIAVAEVRSVRQPSLATVRPGTFAAAPVSGRREGFGWRSMSGPPPVPPLEVVAEGVEGPDPSDLERREVLVAVGLGVGGPEGIDRLRPALERWRAGLVATRRVVDAGWVPRTRQLGLTGRSLAPRLGVLLGVSGSTNHMVGWRRAGALLAVNRDPDAPVFRDVDVGIVGDLETVVPVLTEELARCLER